MKSNKILIVDDTPSIHEDFRKILMTSDDSGKNLEDMADSLFGKSEQDPVYKHINYELESAYQGEEALKMIEKAESEGESYSLVFMDVRMPPGLDGIKTIAKIWEKYPTMEIVICTAYSDYSWVDIIEILGPSAHLLVLKKPFDADEAQQMALSLTKRADKAFEQANNVQQLKCDLENCKQNIAKLEKELEEKK
ncbi:diguanylate cyclase/phosphodiesterase (GGDEF & EAL domains) with PAS/PAC sensor(s) [hydrothermal vent metagenome]|uniref:Diguanylate cyclase/phosphodiesterase (GGDEF & EAL domains) with PAS/PAC sensor(S) n=1 Tax=hydrothermal vent metagenome TaxID=652676 RepID=A0A3B0XX15_9ZZZZ